MVIVFRFSSSPDSPCVVKYSCTHHQAEQTGLHTLTAGKQGNTLKVLWIPVNATSEEEEEEFYKLLPANKADHLCQLWQSCSDLHKIQTVYDIVENPHSIRLSKK